MNFVETPVLRVFFLTLRGILKHNCKNFVYNMFLFVMDVCHSPLG